MVNEGGVVGAIFESCAAKLTSCAVFAMQAVTPQIFGYALPLLQVAAMNFFHK